MEQITLYYQEGKSDKVYQAGINPREGGYAVDFAYGRRGSELNSGTKTPSPVNFQQAQVIYGRLVKDKVAKGYTLGEVGSPINHVPNARQSTGILPQLLNSIQPDQAARLVQNTDWVMQEKFDGKRLLIRKTKKSIEAINRHGLITSMPFNVQQAMEVIPAEFVMDGECIGETFIAFDLLELNGEDCRHMSYEGRLFCLSDLIENNSGHLKMAETASGTVYKAAMLERLRTANSEGVVFKRLDAAYTPGRPSIGGFALKLKFWETASFVVGRVNEQRSVALTLLNEERWVSAGNVTIPANHPVPSFGEVVEVRYLYAFRESGSVYQPIFLTKRDDVDRTTCTVQQLKFKSSKSD